MKAEKLIALFLSIVVILSGFTFSVSAKEIEYSSISITEYELSKTNPIMTLDEVEENPVSIDTEKLRQDIFDTVYNGGSELNIYHFNIPLDNANILSNLIFDSMPELLKTVNKIYFSYYKGENTILFIKFDYSVTNDKFRNIYNKFNIAAKSMVSGLNNKYLTSVQKALVLHDRLAVRCEYDLQAAADLEDFNKNNTDNNAVMPWDAAFCAYGALVEGSAVCQGYSEAYKYLLELVGIKSDLCSSVLLNHVWNIVYIDGKGYHVDVTWDDPVWQDDNGNYIQKPEDYIEHNNFLLSSLALFYNGHNFQGYYDYNFTPSDQKYDNYFWKDCHHETFAIGNGLYHYNEDGDFCVYTEHTSLVDSGKGDIDKDRSIKSTDLSYCRKFLIEELIPTQEQFTACDINNDGEINLSDLVRYKQILMYIN